MNDPLGLGKPEPMRRHTCWWRRIERDRDNTKEWIGSEPPTDDDMKALWEAVHGGQWVYKNLAAKLLELGLADLSEAQIGSCARMECRACRRDGAPDLVADA